MQTLKNREMAHVNGTNLSIVADFDQQAVGSKYVQSVNQAGGKHCHSDNGSCRITPNCRLRECKDDGYEGDTIVHFRAV